MRRLYALVFAIGFGCSSPAPQPKPEDPLTSAQVTSPADESRRFPLAGQVKMELVPAHLLNKPFMPGGNLATYQIGKTRYQQFLAKLPDAQAAAFLLLDWRKALKDNHYLPNMGGFFGMDGDLPVYVFTKGQWVAGTAGLPEAKADAAMRQFAVHL
jgi:hypothetical protein